MQVLKILKLRCFAFDPLFQSHTAVTYHISISRKHRITRSIHDGSHAETDEMLLAQCGLWINANKSEVARVRVDQSSTSQSDWLQTFNHASASDVVLPSAHSSGYELPGD